MTIWNARLIERKLSVKVRRVLRKEPGFMVVVDSRKRHHKLSEIDFPSFKWKEIGVGSTITLTISEAVTRWKVEPLRVKKSVKEFIVETQKKVSGPFFVWICQYCGIKGFVEYEEGDDPWGIAERIILSHEKKAKAGCDKKNIRIFDHRGKLQEDSTRFLSYHNAE
ncbi:MAG: hypothetical protein ABIB55_01385 [Candidatus Nealsonbacteria bacterium]